LARPLIVVLDEAMSGLDVEAARAVHRSLDAAFPERTRLVITHRAGDVEGTDACWQLQDGRLRPALLVG
jgi:ABC-type transport system involved in cytochrome bd biosynthesis fused ATPase/permease subunit